MKKFFKSIYLKLVAAVSALLMLCSCGTSNDLQDLVVDNTGANEISAYSTETADCILSIDASDEIHDISDLLFGAFFEDINFAADGGLYAEMVANRSFEFTELAEDDNLYKWSSVGNSEISVLQNSEDCLNENNPSYLVMKNNTDGKAGIENAGFLEGMSIEKGAVYNLSFYAKAPDGYSGDIQIELAVKNGTEDNISYETAGEASVIGITNQWQKFEISLESVLEAIEGVSLQLLIDKGEVHFDMISLFPEDTYKNRSNGLRADMCQLLEELQPKFLRFPGGCVIEGYDGASAYNWKDSIGVGDDGLPLLFEGTYGDVAARTQGINIWTDINATDDALPGFMSYGLGFFEYFQLAEDIGAVGVPVINAGLYCQARGREALSLDSAEFKQYVQDMHDLIEFCRGDENSTWGKVRAALGHAEPFELRYICIGNENWGQDYYERYSAFLKSFNEAKKENPELYEGIELIYSAGVDDGISGVDYLKSYEYAKEELDKIDSGDAADFAGATDHHYYNEPSWFLKNVDYYDEDNYKREVENMTDTIYGGAIKVFLGEYASWSNNLNSALSEAAYMTGLERNGDIIEMAAYAPLFSSTYARHWAPDLIWFNNNSAMGSINYYVQKLFSLNQGSAVLNHTLNDAETKETALTGAVGVGTWNTSAKFDNILITDNETGEVLGEDKFNIFSKLNWEFPTDGKWKIKNGALTNTTTQMAYSDQGSVAYFGEKDWNNYTYTLEATKLDGAEGFIIPFAVKGTANNIMWNIGGWENTVSTLQVIEGNVKTGQIEGTTKDFTVETGRTYNIKIEVNGLHVKGYIDGELYIDCEFPLGTKSDVYTVVSNDDNGDIIIKLVNVTENANTVAVKIDNADIESEAIINQVAGDSLLNDNVLGADESTHIKMTEFTLDGVSSEFNYTIPAYSVTSLRLKTRGE